MAVIFTGSGKVVSDTWFNPVTAFCGSTGPGFTVSYWVMVTGGSGFPGACTSTQGVSVPSCFYHTIDISASNQLLVGCYDTAGGDHFVATVLLTSNVWFHITCHYEGNLGSGGFQLYVNGRLHTDGSLNASITNTTTNATNGFDIGCGDGSTILTGRMAQMRLFMGRLTPGEVITNMRSSLCPSAIKSRCMFDLPLNSWAGSVSANVHYCAPAGVRFNSVTPTAPLTHFEVFGGTLGGFAPDPISTSYPALQIPEQPWLVATVTPSTTYVATLDVGVDARPAVLSISGDTPPTWPRLSGRRI